MKDQLHHLQLNSLHQNPLLGLPLQFNQKGKKDNKKRKEKKKNALVYTTQ